MMFMLHEHHKKLNLWKKIMAKKSKRKTNLKTKSNNPFVYKGWPFFKVERFYLKFIECAENV